MPSLRSTRPPLSPGAPFSTMNPAIPPSSGTLAKTTWRSAIPPLVMNCLRPSSTHSSPSRRADVAIAAMSEPAWGSVRQSAPRRT